jgi:hypothetical protein
MNKYVKTTIVPACLLTLAGLAGCHGYERYETGLPWIDRWIAPGSVDGWPAEEPIVPYDGPTLPAVPAPPPPSEIIQPKLPALPGDGELETNRESYFGEGIGLTPLPVR